MLKTKLTLYIDKDIGIMAKKTARLSGKSTVSGTLLPRVTREMMNVGSPLQEKPHYLNINYPILPII